GGEDAGDGEAHGRHIHESPLLREQREERAFRRGHYGFAGCLADAAGTAEGLAFSGVSGETFALSCMPYAPYVTTRSPALSPSMISTPAALRPPTFTSRSCATPFPS